MIGWLCLVESTLQTINNKNNFRIHAPMNKTMLGMLLYVYDTHTCARARSSGCFGGNIHAHTAIFIPISERFFLSSHTGLWRLCRYALTPILLTNSTLPQLISRLAETNNSELDRLRKDIADDKYIDAYLHELNGPIASIATIDNHFKRALFAHWAHDTTDFPTLRAKYKTLAPAIANTTLAAAAKQGSKIKSTHYVITNDLALIREAFGVSPISVRLNASVRANVLVPRHLQLALFDEWPNKPNVVRVIGRFAKDMDLPMIVTNANGTRLAIQYPDPPATGNRNGAYRYDKYGKLNEKYLFERECQRCIKVHVSCHFSPKWRCVTNSKSFEILFRFGLINRKLQVSQLFPADKRDGIRSIHWWSAPRYVSIMCYALICLGTFSPWHLCMLAHSPCWWFSFRLVWNDRFEFILCMNNFNQHALT